MGHDKHQRTYVLVDVNHVYERYVTYREVAVRWLVPGEPLPRPERPDELLVIQSDGLVRVLRQVGRTAGGSQRQEKRG